MSLFSGLDGLKVAKAEALAKCRDDRPSYVGSMLAEPKSCRLDGSLTVCETLSNALI